MIIFRNLSFQISPRNSVFLDDPELGSPIYRVLELSPEADVSCSVQAKEDGFDPAGFYGVEISSGISGLAHVDVRNERCDIHIFIPRVQLDFFVKSLAAMNSSGRIIRVTLCIDANYSVSKCNRVYLIVGDPLISMAIGFDQ